ncbi:MAG: hypothetical protein ACXVP3_08990 [Actinomycetota bacterium]
MSRRPACLSLVALVLVALAASPAAAAPVATIVRVTATSGWHRPSPDPTGVTYQRSVNRLVVVDSEVDEMPLYDGANAWSTTLGGHPHRSWTTLAITREPTDVTARGPKTLFLTDDRQHRVIRWSAGADARWGTSDDTSAWFSTRRFSTGDTEGLTFARLRHRTVLLICDGRGSEVYRLGPGPDHRFDGVPPVGDDVLKGSFDTASIGVVNPKGIFYDRQSKLVYIVGNRGDVIARTTVTGTLVDTIDISSLEIVHPSGILMAPASDDPSVRHLYVTDKGVDNNVDPSENDGRLIEISLS